MLEQERQKLFDPDKKYISIGITADGSPCRSIPVPWDSTANAFNMRVPDVYFSRADFEDPEMISRLGSLCVNGCYIFTPLDDYSFLAQFTELWDLHIEYGDAIKDLSFMQNMTEWFQLFIENAHIPDLSPVFPAERCLGGHSRCIAFNKCAIDDISALVEKNPYISELHIWMAHGTGSKKDEQRWRQVRASRFEYYEYPDKTVS